MRKKMIIVLVIVLIVVIGLVILFQSNKVDEIQEYTGNNGTPVIQASSQIKKLTNGLSYVKYEGDYNFDEYLNQGGASSDAGVVQFLMQKLNIGKNDIDFKGDMFGCSTIQAQNSSGDYIFGRNFDWNHCNTMIVISDGGNNYSSISTVNMDFVTSSSRAISLLPDETKAKVAMYAPLDGMNEKGLCVAVNMIQDSSTINQNTDKPDITTTTAVRLLLDKAETVDEAIDLLKQYDMHASMNYMVHFAIVDNTGKSVAVEYVNNEMSVIETKTLTNFYLTEGEKYGIGTSQSHERYEILNKALQDNKNISMEDMKNILDSVSKDNFDYEFASTEWSAVFNQKTKQVNYYHRENYDKCYTFELD